MHRGGEDMVNNLIPGNRTCGRDCSSQDWKAGLERPFNSLQKPILPTEPHFLSYTASSCGPSAQKYEREYISDPNHSSSYVVVNCNRYIS